jgi:hypothetical protein
VLGAGGGGAGAGGGGGVGTWAHAVRRAVVCGRLRGVWRAARGTRKTGRACHTHAPAHTLCRCAPRRRAPPPPSADTPVRGVAHAAHAALLLRPRASALAAVYGAMNAVGLGISVAMCDCLMVIWWAAWGGQEAGGRGPHVCVCVLPRAGVCCRACSRTRAHTHTHARTRTRTPAHTAPIHRLRNAQHHQPAAVAALLRRLGACLVAAVIVCGPVLGVAGAAVAFGHTPPRPTDLQHGARIREASSAVRVGCWLAASAWLVCGVAGRLCADTCVCVCVCVVRAGRRRAHTL